jgi:hypothetical protein
MSDPRREPFPDETMIDPDSPNKVDLLPKPADAKKPGDGKDDERDEPPAR